MSNVPCHFQNEGFATTTVFSGVSRFLTNVNGCIRKFAPLTFEIGRLHPVNLRVSGRRSTRLQGRTQVCLTMWAIKEDGNGQWISVMLSFTRKRCQHRSLSPPDHRPQWNLRRMTSFWQADRPTHLQPSPTTARPAASSLLFACRGHTLHVEPVAQTLKQVLGAAAVQWPRSIHQLCIGFLRRALSGAKFFFSLLDWLESFVFATLQCGWTIYVNSKAYF